uniref:Uroporphyrin-III C-methyltransferase n=1 Tax=Nitratidesulfovibrio vulgaris (strain DSM 19637 / Miyazaki F) TaxID=883 RepID=B8DJQ0_NITV9
MAELRVRRVYETAPAEGADPAGTNDGLRVLVDRLWPRGLARDNARIDHWLRGVAPSDDLRRWFGHDPERWQEFRARYHAELRASAHPDLALLRRLAAEQGRVTLLFAARDETRNNAVALKTFLDTLPGTV